MFVIDVMPNHPKESLSNLLYVKPATSCTSQNIQVVENVNNNPLQRWIEIENPFHFITGVEGAIYFKSGF